jgi:hypothetical protein
MQLVVWKLRPPRLHLAGAGEWGIWLASLMLMAAGLFGNVRAPGLIALLVGVMVARRRVISSPTVLLTFAIVLVAALRNFGNWYAAHAVVDFVVVIVTAGVTVLLIPAALKARLAEASASRVALFAVALPTFVFLMNTNPLTATGDTQPVLPTVVQMLRHGNRDLAAWNDGRWDRFACDGQVYFLRRVPNRDGLYSAYPAGMELFAAPVIGVAMMFGLDVEDATVLARLERITASLVSSGSLALFFLLAAHFARSLTAYAATLLLATGSTFTSTTGLALWQQGGIVFWMLVVLLCEIRNRHGWFQAFACAAMLACRPSAVTFLVPFGIWLSMRDWRRGFSLPLQAMLCYLPWGILYRSLYGSPFGPSMLDLNEHWQPAEHLLGVLISPGRGLFVYQPWLLLLVAIHFRRLHVWWPLFVTVIAAHTLLIASWPVWWGGHCYGSRLMAEVVPLVGLLLLEPLERFLEMSGGPWLIGAFAVLGLAIHLPGAYGTAMAWNFRPTEINIHPERLWQWSDPPFLCDWLH